MIPSLLGFGPFLLGCGGAVVATATGPCDDVSAALGVTVCTHEIPNQTVWDEISGDPELDGVTALASYMTPAADDAPLPTLFVNQDLFPLHYDMLTTAFPDLYAGLTREQYSQMVTDGEDRTYFAGDVAERVDEDGERWFSFVVWEQPADASTTVTEAQVEATWRAIQPAFQPGKLHFVPNTLNQEAALAQWGSTAFPTRTIEDNVDYEAYTEASGFGTVRLYSLSELEEATEAAAFGYQDILVLDEAPFDLERVVSGVVTGTRQGALSHVNVRSAARGTPNCYIRDPFDALADWEGTLVEFACKSKGWSIRAASTSEAEAFWAELRPDPVEVAEPDLDWEEIVPLLELPTASPRQRRTNTGRHGAKGSNLGTLYQRIDRAYQLDGFVVPFSFYDRFMRGTLWEETGLSFQETLDQWLADPEFQSDAAVRRERLEALRAAIQAAPVDEALLAPIEAAILDLKGRDDVMMRFRSSSNAEDALAFGGAGLYDSESGCLADETDGDDEGPSHCDADSDRDRSLTVALTAVWASLWNMAAYEERDWYGIDQGTVAMGVLVNDRSQGEQANVVAFTGNPTAEDDRYLVQAQVGELAVVSAEPGVTPETILVTVEDGEVTGILRQSGSSELESGERVLEDAQVTELASLLWEIDRDFPLDEDPPEGARILLDTEWKVDEHGQLVVKQVRTFLRD